MDKQAIADVLMLHVLRTEVRDGREALRCECGEKVLREEAWADHVARAIVARAIVAEVSNEEE